MEIESGVELMGTAGCELRRVLSCLAYQKAAQFPVRPCPRDLLLFLIHFERTMKAKYEYTSNPRSQCYVCIRDTVLKAYLALVAAFKENGSNHTHEEIFALPLRSRMDDVEDFKFSLSAALVYDTKLKYAVRILLRPNEKMRQHLVEDTTEGLVPRSLPLPTLTMSEHWSCAVLDAWVAKLQIPMATLYLFSHVVQFREWRASCNSKGTLLGAPLTHGAITSSVSRMLSDWWTCNCAKSLHPTWSGQTQTPTDVMMQRVIQKKHRRKNRAGLCVPPMFGSSSVLLTATSLRAFRVCYDDHLAARGKHISEAEVHRSVARPRTHMQTFLEKSPLAV